MSLRICLLLLFTCTSLSAGFAAENPKKDAAKRRAAKRKAVFQAPQDDPKLPRVLLIGDSISIGYTLPTRKLLSGRANLHRIPTNGGPTTRGLQQIDQWLGDKKWDVIHFNWGLHDLKHIGGQKQVSLADYEKNLTKLVARLKRTGAKLIWCSTTPVPQGGKPHRLDKDVQEYNAVAAKIMKANDIPTNDLYSFALERLDKIQRPRNAHFTPEGSKVLAGEVARQIEKVLKTHSQ